MKKVLVFLMFCLLSNSIFAIGTGPATKYEITMKKMELCTGYPDANANDVTCSGAVVLGEKSMTMDIASVGVGASVANFADISGLPMGTTYTHMRATLGKDFSMKGYAGSDDSGDSTTCWCRTETDATFDSTTGKYLSRAAGVCESSEADAIANQEVQAMWVSSKATNRVCQENNCSSSGRTSSITNSIEADGVDMDFYGLAMDAGTTNSTTEMQIIYSLTTPYTVGPTIPKLNVSFGTKLAFMSTEYVDDKCTVSPFYPKVQITITD